MAHTGGAHFGAPHLHTCVRRLKPDSVKRLCSGRDEAGIACCKAMLYSGVSTSSDLLSLLEPGLSLGIAGTEDRPEREGLQRFDAAELQRGLAHLV